MRTLSENAKASINAINSPDVYLGLLTISHADLVEDIRVVNNNEDITSRGLVFQAFAFEITLPTESPDTTPSLELKIGNVDRQISDTLLAISTPAQVKYECVLSSDPDSVEFSNEDLIMRVATITPLDITSSLLVDDILAQAFPKQKYSPTYFKGII